MNITEERNVARRRMVLLVPAMIAANAFLFLCMAVLILVALNGGESLGVLPFGADANQRIVRDYLAQSAPTENYRIREWFPARPLEASLVTDGRASSPPLVGQGFAQRVKLAVYGPTGAKNVDTIFWIQHGTVTRVTETDGLHGAREL